MSIYDNETKICPDLNLLAPQEPQTYRLKKSTEIEAFFLDEIETRRRDAKKKKRINITRGIETGLTTSAVITGGASIPAFPSSAGLPVCAALSGVGAFLSLLTVVTRRVSKSQKVKQRDISPAEFHKVLQEREKYCKLKADIRNRIKAKVKQIEKEQREEISEQGRKEGKEDFFTANHKFFRYSGCQCHLKYESPPPYGM